MHVEIGVQNYLSGNMTHCMMVLRVVYRQFSILWTVHVSTAPKICIPNGIISNSFSVWVSQITCNPTELMIDHTRIMLNIFVLLLIQKFWNCKSWPGYLLAEILYSFKHEDNHWYNNYASTKMTLMHSKFPKNPHIHVDHMADHCHKKSSSL